MKLSIRQNALVESVMSLSFASWNQLNRWLVQLDGVRQCA